MPAARQNGPDAGALMAAVGCFAGGSAAVFCVFVAVVRAAGRRGLSCGSGSVRVQSDAARRTARAAEPTDW